MDSEDFSLALEEARRGADGQAAQLTSLRSQTAGTVAIGGLCATFLTGRGGGSDLSAWGWAGVAAFSILVVLAAVVSWPVRFRSSQDPAVIVGWVESGAGLDRQKRDLALHMGRQYEENANKVRVRLKAHSVALVVLLIEVTCLIVDLRGT